ncbi:uncharacterized protein L203_100387 [Cryptococcus depauperatus CBS 7841]|uniref:Uncharacterized protein n=1 Tax=Cryptococcus depauperatus CBS 7841 TaxID=1295531 RepID=A0A1E3HZQ7_9TREE|nr:hypothetical protein L203_05742 [Cryptococcus depauperatus CBS 7841]
MPLPDPGAAGFTPLLLKHVQQHPNLKGWSVNPSLFSILLLVLIVNKGGLIVDVEEYGRNEILQVVQAMVQSIFGLSTGYISLGRSTHTEELPWKLFRHDPLIFSRGPRHSPKLAHTPSRRTATVKGWNQRFADSETETSYHNLDQARLDLPDVLIVTGLENAPSTVQMKINEYLRKKQIEVWIDPVGEDGERRTRTWRFNPLIIWIRQKTTKVPCWVIDHFGCNTSLHPSVISLPPRDLRLGAIVPKSYISILALLLPFTYIHPPLSIHISNLFSAVNGHPALHSTLTQRAVRTFPDFVRAHRLLLGGFDLPEDFETRLYEKHFGTKDSSQKGKETMSNWINEFCLRTDWAGEVPDIRDLLKKNLGEEDIENWYATLFNVEGVWKVCMAHRVRQRQEREEVMWLMTGSLAEETKKKDIDGREDRILNEILQTV